MKIFKNLSTLLQKNQDQQYLSKDKFLKKDNSQEILEKELADLQKQYKKAPNFKGKYYLSEKLDKHLNRVRLGIKGEKKVAEALARSDMEMYILCDVYFENQYDSGKQIDLIAITHKHIYLLESKFRQDNAKWIIDAHAHVSCEIKKKNKIESDSEDSPFLQIDYQLSTIKEVIENDLFLNEHIPAQRLCNMIVFSNSKADIDDAEAPESATSKIITLPMLIDFMKETDSHSKLSPLPLEVMWQIGDTLLRYASPDPNDYTKKYRTPLLCAQNKSNKQNNTHKPFDCSSAKPETNNKIETSEELSDDYLREQLIKYRKDKAREKNPDNPQAFSIFYDRTMEELIVKRPKTLEELAKIDRLGPNRKTYQEYGKDILKILNGELSFPDHE